MSASVRQLQTLQALHKSPEGVSLRQLGEKLGITHVSALQSLKLLEREGLVKLKPVRKLTANGLKALKNAAADLRASLADVA